ncbi:hypothetical protein DV515_00007225 [Chloebia gouldiae]|uniref:Uncharacterized protein n=1 Tax=Chloebia gouldiae TaxID=44316 RepID=A0A3L8SIT4_CHLGU|nr:hypothetical protein DV515_00007225 [Chloebia gouldiae]
MKKDLSLRKCEKAGNLQSGNVVWQWEWEMERQDCGMSLPRREPFTSSFVSPTTAQLVGEEVVIHCKMTPLFPPKGSKDAAGAKAFPDIRGLFLLLVFLFVMWKEFAADFQKYILLERSERCLDDVPVHVYYGWSFMFAAAGVPLVLLSGLLFFLRFWRQHPGVPRGWAGAGARLHLTPGEVAQGGPAHPESITALPSGFLTPPEAGRVLSSLGNDEVLCLESSAGLSEQPVEET